MEKRISQCCLPESMVGVVGSGGGKGWRCVLSIGCA